MGGVPSWWRLSQLASSQTWWLDEDDEPTKLLLWENRPQTQKETGRAYWLFVIEVSK